MASRSVVDEREPAYALTGHLPGFEVVQALVDDAQRRFKSNRDGENSEACPALAWWPPPLRLALALTEGGCHDDLRP
jgi:glutaminase